MSGEFGGGASWLLRWVLSVQGLQHSPTAFVIKIGAALSSTLWPAVQCLCVLGVTVAVIGAWLIVYSEVGVVGL